MQECPAAVDALVLLKAWLRRRPSYGLPEGITGFLLTALVTHRIQAGALPSTMASHQVLRAMLAWLAETDLTSMVVRLCPARPTGGSGGDAEGDSDGDGSGSDSDGSGSDSDDSSAKATATAVSGRRRTRRHAPLIETDADFQSHFDVVVVGPSGVLNLAADVSASAVHELRRDASMALLSVRADNPLPDGVQHLFTQAADPALAYDRVFAIPYPRNPMHKGSGTSWRARVLCVLWSLAPLTLTALHHQQAPQRLCLWTWTHCVTSPGHVWWRSELWLC